MRQSVQHLTQHLHLEPVPVGYQVHSFIFKIQTQLLAALAQQEVLVQREVPEVQARPEQLDLQEHPVELERLARQEVPVLRAVLGLAARKADTEQAVVVVTVVLTIWQAVAAQQEVGVQQEILVVQVVTEHLAEQVVPVELVVTELTEQPAELV